MSVHVKSEGGVVWQTLLVHLCEIRQVLKRFGFEQIRSLLDEIIVANSAVRLQIRSDHKTLMARAYAGGSMCHAVCMVLRSARRLHIKLHKCADVLGPPTKELMQALVIDFAKTQLSPKLNVHCIPEWRSMRSNANALYTKFVNHGSRG